MNMIWLIIIISYAGTAGACDIVSKPLYQPFYPLWRRSRKAGKTEGFATNLYFSSDAYGNDGFVLAGAALAAGAFTAGTWGIFRLM